MGYIGSKSAITKLSQLENDIGYKKCKGTVKEFMVSSGRFNGVTWLTAPKKEYPVFKVPRYTSEVNNDAGFGPGKFLDINQNVLKNGTGSPDEKIISTLDPNDNSISNIQVPTSESQLYNSAGYTNNIGTVEKLTVSIDNEHPTSIPSTGITLTGANISFSMINNISKLTNNTGLLTPTAFKDYFKYIQLTTMDNTYFTFLSDAIASVNFYFIRYGKIRILHGGVVKATVGGSDQNNTVTFAIIKNNDDKPKDAYEDLFVGYGTSSTYNTKGAISIADRTLDVYGRCTCIEMICWNGGTKNNYEFYIHAEWLAR